MRVFRNKKVPLTSQFPLTFFPLVAGETATNKKVPPVQAGGVTNQLQPQAAILSECVKDKQVMSAWMKEEEMTRKLLSLSISHFLNFKH